VPFLLEDELKRLGGRYEKNDDWADFTVVDGRLITGQNPSSSGSAAVNLLAVLRL
jgi:putative intracellular protease/amidase